jgi:hypothetical protein
VRLASQLIGWQIDLYGSREWVEKGVAGGLFDMGGQGDGMETSDFPLSELQLSEGSLAALEAAGYRTFLDIIDLERDDLLKVEGIDEEGADAIVAIIDELTVVEGEEELEAEAESESDGDDAEAPVKAEGAAEDADAEGSAEDDAENSGAEAGADAGDEGATRG